MSMMGTLGKIAMGIMVAKGVGSAMGGSGSNIGSLLGNLLGGDKTASGNNNQQSGGLGGLLNSLSGNSNNSNTSSNDNDLGSLLSSAFQGNEVKAEPDQEKQAELILKAMISAAKADGSIDVKEQQKITEHIGDVTQEEIEFVRNEMQSPLDLQGLIDSVPQGMEQQIYMMSLLAIDLDSKPEAIYIDKLAKGLNISQQASNDIHQRLGVPKLYS